MEYGVQVTLLGQPHLSLLPCALEEASGHRSLQLLWEKAGLREHASARLPVFGGRFRVLRTTAVGTDPGKDKGCLGPWDGDNAHLSKG